MPAPAFMVVLHRVKQGPGDHRLDKGREVATSYPETDMIKRACFHPGWNRMIQALGISGEFA